MQDLNTVIARFSRFRDLGLTRILDWVVEEREAFYFEPSSRFDTEGMHQDRGLFYLPTADFCVRERPLLSEVLLAMKAPPSFCQSIFRFLPSAQGVHFGFDQRENVLACKCYLEFPAVSGSRLTQTMQYLGYKWSPTQGGKSVVSKYRLVSKGNVTQAFSIWKEKMTKNLISGHWTTFNFDLFRCDGALDQEIPCGDSVSADLDCHVLQIQDEGSERYSVDVNLYSQKWKVSELLAPLQQAVDFSPVRERQWNAWSQSIIDEVVGHIATGYDQEQKPFLTLYHGAHLFTAVRR